MKKITHKQLVDAIGDKTAVSKPAIRAVLKAFVDIVDERMKEGKQTPLYGLGVFTPLLSEVGEHRNPKTGEKVDLGTYVKPFLRFTQDYRVYLRKCANVEEATKNIKHKY